MAARYKVHSYHETSVPVPAEMADGRKVMGSMPAIIVELVPLADYGRTLTYEAPAEDLEAARVLFKEGNIVELAGFTLVEEEKKP